jgi:hypothetical protein
MFFCTYLISSLYDIFVRRKVCICGLVEVRKSQQILGPLHLRKVRKFNKLLKSESLRIFASQNLFADRPPWYYVKH